MEQISTEQFEKLSKLLFNEGDMTKNLVPLNRVIELAVKELDCKHEEALIKRDYLRCLFLMYNCKQNTEHGELEEQTLQMIYDVVCENIKEGLRVAKEQKKKNP